ncbi:MAG TPA: GNAT family N-acetyltransferase [Candidatus Limnocylindrales bacterium]
MLPAGYTSRPATTEDAKDIYDIICAHQVPVLGKPDTTLEDVADELIEPAWDITTDGWLVHDPAGAAVGWGWACRKGTSSIVDIDIYVRPEHDGIAGWLWAAAQERALAIALELGHAEATIDIGVFPDDATVTEVAKANGFAPAATYLRLRIDHTGRVAHPPVPDGVELRCATDEAVRRNAIDVRNESFADHFGSVPRSYEEWFEEREASSANDWALVHVAYVEGEPAALLLRTNNFVPDENCGYVLTLGTIPKFRNRGLASYLLRYAFAEDAAAGRIGTILHVDTNPERPALGFYRRNGMRPVRTIDIYRRRVPVGG